MPHPPNRIRLWFLFVAVAWAIFLLLGSWYPFQYRDEPWLNAVAAWRQNGLQSHLSKTDVAVNLLIGIPLGFFGGLAVLRRHDRSIAQLLGLLAIFVVAVFWAAFIEIGQHWFGSRVSSLSDTIMQASGAFFGLSLAWVAGVWFRQRIVTLLGWNQQTTFVSASLDLYFVGYTAWMLMPFVPALSPSELKAKWLSTDLSPFSIWHSDPSGATYTAVVASLTAIPIGLLIGRRLGTPRDPIGILTAMVGSALFVVVLELFQFFIETRVAAADDALWSAGGTLIGAGIGCRWLDSEPVGIASAPKRKSSTTAPLFGMLTLIYAGLYLLVAWYPFDFVTSRMDIHAAIERFRSAAFSSLLGGNQMLQLSNLIRDFGWSLPLGILLRMVILDLPTRRMVGLIVIAMMGSSVSIVAEVGQILAVSRDASLLNLAVRLLGLAVGVIATSAFLVSRRRPRMS